MLLLCLVLLPFVGSLLVAFLPAHARNRAAGLAGCTAFLGLLLAAYLYLWVGVGEVLRFEARWLPAYGLNFMLRMDGLAWLFSILVLGIGVLVILYARYYMSPEDPVPRFFAFLLAFMGAMLGVVLSGNLIQLVIFWELTSLTSFLLIGYWHHRIDVRRGARMAFTVTTIGGLCLLAGVLLLGRIVGSYDLDVVLAAGDVVRAHAWYVPALVLVALGALTKSAQFPFHFWLPHAMAAPTPVSAYLHSATMVKAGVFLLMRLWPVLSGTPEWTWLIGGAGVCTLLLGSFVAIFQHDLKGLLAYSTISHLGLITVLLGIGTPLSVVAAIFHTMNHAIFKASLFMAAGIIDHETGTRDMRVLRGLYKAIPFTAMLAIVASAAMAGVPLLNGFLSKEMFFAETVHVGGTENWWMSYAAVAMGIFSVAYSLRFISVFFGPLPDDLPKKPHEPPRWMRFPVEFLVLLCVVVGMVPELTVGHFLAFASVSVLGQDIPSYDLGIWHGFNLALMMSLVALSGGILFYVLLRKYYALASRNRVPLLHRLKGSQAYETTMLTLFLSASWLVDRLGTRRLQPQLLVIVVALVAIPLMLVRPLPQFAAPQLTDADPLFALMWMIGGACAIAAAWKAKYHRLAALLLVGGTGIATSMTFLWLSAPDLALTQLMVETVTTVLILLGLRWLPPRRMPQAFAEHAPRAVQVRRARDFVVALAGGLGLAAISYAVLTHPAPSKIGDYFVTRALPEGGGTNVVNVLLVDFRGFDTMGEITVLAIVALTVYALLRRFRPAPESVAIPSQQASDVDPAASQSPTQQARSGYLMIPSVYLRFLLPFMGIVVAYFFMRGHNLPGGGFVAGLIFATAIIVQYMIAGTAWVESHIRLRPHRWIAYGLLIACVTGLGAWVLGFPFLTSHTAHLHLPVLGDIHVPSAFLFDLGVFATVVGSTMLILVALAHQSVRSHRVPGGEPAAILAIPTEEIS
ncbi:monovalent cation/H+ antiporter subunit A [Noviherbaspirillum suwonense]|uniref:Multisubunit potassium/proton antiporter, PhaA subunit /multisubunit potassium/proton antiporter, PhaB subunit n=1 Tax=Noviherbaspirillum suwonense TaxID=1224511 RepID=A0ABY1QS65_9BURK|nr:monovalent cation/H+ antiporter subunit A [Noviherbaspirillum suwonense]SMP77328.1 multisubunit potassium/proton antiporter, PhaA subunit /multisubunit potassium/proton antiporter, PhaB subunit [Noviherbaspirillum suwonense]